MSRQKKIKPRLTLEKRAGGLGARVLGVKKKTGLDEIGGVLHPHDG